jgi:hypothetical protein
MTHRFRVGQKVQLTRSYPLRMAADGFYEVIRQLPDNAGEFYYRIKSSREAHERVAKESELEKAWAKLCARIHGLRLRAGHAGDRKLILARATRSGVLDREAMAPPPSCARNSSANPMGLKAQPMRDDNIA